MAYYPGSLNLLFSFLSDIADWNSLDKSTRCKGCQLVFEALLHREFHFRMHEPPTPQGYNIIYNIAYQM